MKRSRAALLAFAVFVTAIAVSNWLISHVGIPAGPGTHLSPVGFGLLAPSGVWAAALTFPARDVVQRLGGRGLGLLAILAGAGLSLLISDHRIAVASALTYLVSESADFLVYTPLQRRWFTPAVFLSGCVAAVIDSAFFLHLAGIPTTITVLGGLILGKFWVQMAAAPIALGLRRTKTFSSTESGDSNRSTELVAA